MSSSSTLKSDPACVFNLANSIGSSSRVPTLFPDDYEIWVLHMEDYLQGLENGYELWKSVIIGPYRFSVEELMITVTSIE